MPVKINGSSSGSVTLQAPASGSDVTVTLPAATGTLLNTPGAWTTYTPTLGGTGWALGTTGASATGAYCKIGRLVVFWANVVFGSSGATFGASAAPTLTIPVTASSGDARFVSLVKSMYYDSSTGNQYTGAVQMDSTDTFLCITIGTNGVAGAVTSTVPFTWAASDQIYIGGSYESAA